MTGRRKTGSWRNKLLLLLLLFAVLPMLGIGIWHLHKLDSTFEKRTLESLDAIAHARAAAIDQLIDDRRRAVKLLAPQIVPHLVRLEEAEANVEAAAPVEEAAPPEPLPELEDAQGLRGAAPLIVDEERAQDAGVAVDSGPGGRAPGNPQEQPEAPVTRAPGKKEKAAAKAVDEAMGDLHQALGLILWDQEAFEELLVIDDEGVVVASTFDQHEGKTAKRLKYFENGLGATYLQPVFLSPITEQLTMVISTPIRNQDRQVIGVLAARLNLTRFFRLINDMTGLGATGEIVVGKKDEDTVIFMAPTRHDAQAVLQRSVQLGAKRAIPLQEAARGLQGKGLRKDYRGIQVLATWMPVPSLGWGLVVKLDHEEAMSDVQALRLQLALVALGLLMVVVVAAFVVSRELVRSLRELKDATDRISRGDLDVQLEIRSNDEIGELADSFERMVAAIKFFREHARKADEDAEVDEPDEAPAETQ